MLIFFLPMLNIFQSLAKDEKPKGMCNLPAALASNAVGVLVLVGTAKPTDATFPSSSSLAHFTLSLRFFPTRPGENLCDI